MKLKLLLFALLPALLFLVSCRDEPADTPPALVPEAYMALKIVVPGTTDASTRALEAVDECEIQTIDVLAFNTADNKYLYHEVGTDIYDDPSGVDGNTKIFHVEVPQDGLYTEIYFMVIANAHQNVEDAKSAGAIATTKTKDEVMRSLTFNASGVWPVKPGIFTRFPMWGLSQNIDLTAASVIVPPITLMRSVAKIDVGINFPANSDVAAGLGNLFKLEEIYVYNAHDKLFIAPDPDNYTADKATAPSIPADAGVNTAMRYELRIYNPDKFAHMNEIYVAEHAKGVVTEPGRENNLCLIIGARYGSTDTEGTDITYYRIDFIKITRNDAGDITSQEFLDILRNHRYRVNIVKVDGQGYDTVEEAFNAIGLNSNLTVDIVDTDESLTEFVYDGQYALGVSKGSYIVDKNTHSDVELIVSTTHEQGWKAVSDVSWLTFVEGTDQQDTAGKSILKFNVTANNSTERVAKITIQSGRLFKEITVTQRKIGFIEIVGHYGQYIMDISKDHTFQVKATYDWQVKIKSDPYNIIRTFTTSGTSNITGTSFYFKLENDIFYQTILDQNAVLTFYSLTNEFDEFDVTIRGVAAYDLGGVHVYHEDQLESLTWYVYSNTPGSTNQNSTPPTSGAQSDPPRTYSCANLPTWGGNVWRLPTQTELVAIYKAASTEGIVTHYGFSNSNYYWTASTYGSTVTTNARVVRFDDGNQTSIPKTNTTNKARCVRSK